jgi:hypothetical protein
MTLIKTPVRRETASLYRRRPLVILAHPRHLEIKEKKRRDSVSVSYEAIYEFALSIRFRQQQAEKRAKRRAKS